MKAPPAWLKTRRLLLSRQCPIWTGSCAHPTPDKFAMELLWIISLIFLFFDGAAVSHAATKPTELTARPGQNLTLWTGLNSSIHAILSCDEVTLLNCDEGHILQIKDNIRADVQDGTIVMQNVKREDSNLYRLQIYSNSQEIIEEIRVNVTEPPQSVDETKPTQGPGSEGSGKHLAGYIAAGVIGLVVVGLFSLVLYWKRDFIHRKMNDPRIVQV